MPPSGYSPPQSSSIRHFLASCSVALSDECKERNEPLASGLQREIADIDRYCADEAVTSIQQPVLQLTRAFYDAVLAKVNFGSSYESSVAYALDDVERQVLAVHIEQKI
jgi:hypothetical protein